MEKNFEELYKNALKKIEYLNKEIKRLKKIETEYNWVKYPDRMGQ